MIPGFSPSFLPRMPRISLAAFLLCGVLSTHASADGIKPKSPAQLQFENGVSELNQKHFAVAETDFKKAIELDPNFVLPYVGLSDLAKQRGDIATASTYLQKAISLAPDNAAVLTAWGQFLFSQKRFPEAEKAYQKAIQLDPKSAVIPGQLGDLYLLGMKKPSDAASVYRQSLALDPVNPHINFMFGLALLALDQPQEAEPQLVKARDLYPSNLALRKALADLNAFRQTRRRH